MEPGDLPTYSKDYYRGRFDQLRYEILNNIDGMCYAIDMAQRYEKKQDFVERFEAIVDKFYKGFKAIEKELFSHDATE